MKTVLTVFLVIVPWTLGVETGFGIEKKKPREDAIRLPASDYSIQELRFTRTDRTPIPGRGSVIPVPYAGAEMELLAWATVHWNRAQRAPSNAASVSLDHPAAEFWIELPGEGRPVMCGRFGVFPRTDGDYTFSNPVRIPAGLATGQRIQLRLTLARLQPGSDSNPSNNELSATLMLTGR